MKFIIDQDSGTLVSLDNCVFLEEDDLNEDQLLILNEGSDNERINIGHTVGTSLKKTLEGCGYGDLNYNNCASFSPRALKDEISERLSNDPDDETNQWLATLNVGRLETIGWEIMNDDGLWEAHQTAVMHTLHREYLERNE